MKDQNTIDPGNAKGHSPDKRVMEWKVARELVAMIHYDVITFGQRCITCRESEEGECPMQAIWGEKLPTDILHAGLWNDRGFSSYQGSNE